jgi:protein SCO1/2
MLQKAFRKDPKKEFRIGNEIQFLSISVDPGRDSFPLLRKYADRFDIDHDRWWFLTGDRGLIYNFARKELSVSMQPGDGGAEDFIHTEKIVVLDQEGFIRGFYNGLDTADIRRCADDIVLLTMARKRKS